jgi:riboflavin biosynthesis pyrimidine reductase
MVHQPTAGKAPLDDDGLLALYAPPPGQDPWVRFNFVSTLDGAATHGGVSGGLGTAADKRIFALLRRHADVILVGAGTIRAEGYGGDLVDGAGRAWRTARGVPAHPGIAVVSAGLNLDPASEFFARAPVRPLVLTTADAPLERAGELAEVADVVRCGEHRVDPRRAAGELASRGLRRIHSEGGPTLFADFQEADLVDSLCLSLSPLLAGGTSRRIADGAGEHPLRRMALNLLLEEDSALFLEYRRAHAEG